MNVKFFEEKKDLVELKLKKIDDVKRHEVEQKRMPSSL